jgi:hypothetical protein
MCTGAAYPLAPAIYFIFAENSCLTYTFLFTRPFSRTIAAKSRRGCSCLGILLNIHCIKCNESRRFELRLTVSFCERGNKLSGSVKDG